LIFSKLVIVLYLYYRHFQKKLATLYKEKSRSLPTISGDDEEVKMSGIFEEEPTHRFSAMADC
jgi:hypothetical protein